MASNTVNVTVTEAPAPSLSVVKSADETEVVEGDTIHLHVTVENTGNVALNDVTIDDPNGPDCEAAPFDLAVGADTTTDCTHVAVAGDVPTYTNVASATSDEVTTPVESNEVEVTVEAAAPSLTIVKSADEVSVSPGQTIHYHLVVTNTGNVALTDVVVADPAAPDCSGPVADIAVGQSALVDCAYTATGADAGATYENVATVDTAQTPAQDSNQVDVDVDDAFTVVKAAEESEVEVGDPIHYEITIDNTSAITLTGITVDDPNAPACEQAVPDLAPGADHTVECVYTPTVADSGTYTNVATVDTAQTPAVASNQADVLVAHHALSVVKTADEAEVEAGATIHYEIVITNTGNRTLTGFTVDDPKADDCEQAVPDLAVGEDHTIECTYDTVVADAGTYTNVATVDTDQTPAVSSNDADAFVAHAAMSVDKAADQTGVIVGDDIDYEVTVTNTGNVELTDVEVSDANAPDCAGAIPDLGVGEDHTVDCSYTTTGADAGTYTNTATADSAETDPVDSNQVDVTVAVAAPSLTIVKSADEASVSPGQAIHYHLVVTNTGNVPLNAVDVVDAAAPDCGDDAVFDLAVGAFTTVDCTYTTTGNDVGTYSNTASVVSDETASQSSNQKDVTVTPAVSVVKSADQTAVVAGEAIDYHVEVTNTSALTLSGLEVDDPNAPDCDGTVADLAPGEDVTVDCTYTTTGADVGTYSNVATVDSAAIVAVESNEVEVAVEAAAPGLSVVKSADEVSVVPGQAVHYHLVVSNTGNVPLNAVDVVDAAAPDCGDDPVFDLAVGAFTTIDCEYATTGNDTGTFENTASVTAAQVSTPVVSNTVEVEVGPSVSVVLSADETSVVAGETVHYEFEVTNVSALSLSGLAVSGSNAPGCEAQVVPVLSPGGDATVACGYVTLPVDVGVFTNTVTVDSADVVAVTSNPVHVEVTVPPSAGLVSGVVTRAGSGDPVAGAVAGLLSAADFSLVAVDLTDAAGGFAVAADPGSYVVYVFDGSGRYAPAFHGAPSPVVVSAGGQVDADVEVASTRGAIDGTVTADGSGDPLAGMLAVTIGVGSAGPGAGAFTDGDGRFSVEGLRPGSHLVEFVDLAGGHEVEFFDDAGAPASASLVTVAGAATTTADAGLAATAPPAGGAHLTGTVASDGGGELAGMVVLALRASDFSLAAGAVTDAGGGYDVEVDPGDYRLGFYDPAAAYGFEWHDDLGPEAMASSTVVTATAGTPAVVDAELTATTGSVSGTVTATGAVPLDGVLVVAISSGTVVASTVSDAAGNYELAGLAPGGVRVRFVVPNGSYVPVYHSGVVDYAAATVLDVTAGSTTTGIDAALTPTGG